MAGVATLLDAARDAAARTISNFTGAAAERAWDNILAAEEILKELSPTDRTGESWWRRHMSRWAASPHLDNPAGRLKAASWRQFALAHITELDARAEALRKTLNDARAEALLDGAQKNLDAARDAAARTHGNLSGAATERTWNNIHAAECTLLELAPKENLKALQIEALFLARQNLSVEDPRLLELEALLGGTAASANHSEESKNHKRGHNGRQASRYGRYVASRALRAAHVVDASDKMQARSFRNILYGSAVMLLAVTIGLAVLGTLKPSAFGVCFSPNPSTTVCPAGGNAPGAWDLLLVEVIGLSAAALTAAIALRKLDGTSTPYSIPLALTFLKLPTGALSAVIGITLISAGVVPGLNKLETSTQILAWAAIFGAGQIALTRFVDDKGQEVLSSVSPATTVDAGDGVSGKS
ncbi:hypothetical protein ACFU3E_06425 [Streptomyces sp. NPDC057424]|uniref:hypothetical protein n=1 Tax=Streptomyces sp. NPDC057424 TaxID=3346127 RepID=UPI0036A28E72